MIRCNRYGEEFKKGMEEGHWDLSKVDYDEVAKSQVSLIFGQMNEHRVRVSRLRCPV